MRDALTPVELAQYHRDGYIIKRQVFSPAECDALIDHMMALHAGKKRLKGFAPRESGSLGRTHNQHVYDDVALAWLIHPRLYQPLSQCFGAPPEAIQTMYFWVGSTQRRHQDAYYLPDCMSAWIALTDVTTDNGTIWVQPGSHRLKLLAPTDLGTRIAMDLHPRERYNDWIDEIFEANERTFGLGELPVIANRGDVVYFHGTLIHRGGPIGKPGSFRHVLANHYIPATSTQWPYPDWPRYDFNGSHRLGN